MDIATYLTDGQLVCTAHLLVICHTCCVNFSGPTFRRGSEEKNDDDRVFVLGQDVNRFMPQWDEQVLGPKNTIQVEKDYDKPPKPEQLQISAVLACSRCELTWLVGNAGQSAAANHPSHHTLYHEYAGTRRSLIVWTDGACINNGQPNAKAGVGVYFGLNSKYNICSPLQIPTAPTSQKAELYAILQAMQVIRKEVIPARSILVSCNRDKKRFRLVLVTDSSYTVESMCKHWKDWKVVGSQKVLRNQKGEEIVNSEVFLAIKDEVEKLSRDGVQVAYYHVPREINSEADALAKAGLALESEVEKPPPDVGVTSAD